jgi:hypothetical protein
MKPFAIYGKKPRGSKTSKREILSGIPVFLHSSTIETRKNVVCYHDKPPYPRIIVSAGETYWACRLKIEEFFSKNSLEIKETLETLDKNYGLPKNLMDAKIKSFEYEIYDSNPRLNGYSVVTPFHNGEFLYLWADASVAPTKTYNGKVTLDKDLIFDEYLKRKIK